MINLDLPYFGLVDLNQLEEYYSSKTEHDGCTVRLDLNFENRSMNEEQAKDISAFLSNIAEYETQNKSHIEKDFNNEGESADYINFYLEELNQEGLSSIIDSKSKEFSNERHLLEKLKLVRVGLYPDGKYNVKYYGVFDYSIEIDGELSNQLLVVKTNKKGDLDHITWES